MSKDSADHVELEGTIVDVCKGGNFRVEVAAGHLVLAKLSGKLRQNKIHVVLGDRVKVKVSTYDPGRGFIFYRER